MTRHLCWDLETEHSRLHFTFSPDEMGPHPLSRAIRFAKARLTEFDNDD